MPGGFAGQPIGALRERLKPLIEPGRFNSFRPDYIIKERR